MFCNIGLYHLFLGYKAKEISIDKEPVAVMNSEGQYISCPQMMIDTGDKVATCISGNLVTQLGLDSNIDYDKKIPYETVGGGDDRQPISKEANSIEINVKIRNMTFRVRALYDVTAKKIDVIIGMDIIDQLFEKGFTLGK